MSAINSLFSNFHPGKVFVNCVRWASKKAGGSSKNRKGHAIGKRRGLKAFEGQHVSESSILMRQLGLRLHPGLNVEIGKDGSLYALEPGRVIISCERYEPNFNNFWAQKFYEHRKDNVANLHKKYVNIIPDPQVPRFKLIEKV